jgi:hypothetical protein
MDIVERLRDWCEDPHDVSMGELAKYSHDAANEIEQLRKLEARYWEFASKYDSLLIDVGRLREALERIANSSNWGGDGCWDADSYPNEIAEEALKEE